MEGIKKALAAITPRQVFAVIIGNIILGFGAALMRVAGMGNDPFLASGMVISETLSVGLGNYQAVLNIFLIIVQLCVGRKYLGLGTIVNMFGLGYVIQFSLWFLQTKVGLTDSQPLWVKILLLIVSMAVLSFGLSMYQCSKLGVAPYDYLSLGMTDHLPTSYFFNRIVTDCTCVAVILGVVISGAASLADSHLGVATILTAFCLGPFVSFMNRINNKWIYPEK